MRKGEPPFRSSDLTRISSSRRLNNLGDLTSFRKSALTQKVIPDSKIIYDISQQKNKTYHKLPTPEEYKLKFGESKKVTFQTSMQKNSSMRNFGIKYGDDKLSSRQKKLTNFEQLHSLLNEVTQKYNSKQIRQGSQTDRVHKETFKGQQDYDLLKKRDRQQFILIRDPLSTCCQRQKSKKLESSKSTFNILHLTHKRTNSNTNIQQTQTPSEPLISRPQYKTLQRESYIQIQRPRKSKQKSLKRQSNLFYSQSEFSLSTNFTFQGKHLEITDFIILNQIQSGRTGQVHKCLHRSTLTLYAIKVIKKTTIKTYDENRFITQIKIQLYVKHPNIVNLYGFFSDQENVYLVMEYCEGGNLYDFVKGPQLPSQKLVAGWVKDITKALSYLHGLKIVHRDIKPQNIGVAKLCDFGCAAVCKQRRLTNIGTFDYLAPQMLKNQQYDQNVDVWGLGIMTYELLTGKAPFYHSSKQTTVKKILTISFPESMSTEAQSFINMLLIRQPKQRCSALVMQHHSFISKNCHEVSPFA